MSLQILLINGSPRVKNNTSYLIQRAISGVQSVNGAELKTYEFAKKEFHGCNGICYSYCMKNGKCCVKDDFNDFMKAFLEADGIIWGDGGRCRSKNSMIVPIVIGIVLLIIGRDELDARWILGIIGFLALSLAVFYCLGINAIAFTVPLILVDIVLILKVIGSDITIR
jgi:hypothetical protein